jgi:hypothetical protein
MQTDGQDETRIKEAILKCLVQMHLRADHKSDRNALFDFIHKHK